MWIRIMIADSKPSTHKCIRKFSYQYKSLAEKVREKGPGILEVSSPEPSNEDPKFVDKVGKSQVFELENDEIRNFDMDLDALFNDL